VLPGSFLSKISPSPRPTSGLPGSHISPTRELHLSYPAVVSYKNIQGNCDIQSTRQSHLSYPALSSTHFRITRESHVSYPVLSISNTAKAHDSLLSYPALFSSKFHQVPTRTSDLPDSHLQATRHSHGRYPAILFHAHLTYPVIILRDSLQIIRHISPTRRKNLGKESKKNKGKKEEKI